MSVNIIMQFEVKQKLVLLQFGDKFVFYIEHKSTGFSKQSQKFFIQTTKNFGKTNSGKFLLFVECPLCSFLLQEKNYPEVEEIVVPF